MGALIAFEVARRLRQAGETPAALILLDPPKTGVQATPSHDVVFLLRWFLRDLTAQQSDSWDIQLSALRDLSTDEQLEHVIAQARTRNVALETLDTLTMTNLQRLYGAFRAHARAIETYTPASLHIKAQLFVAEAGGQEAIRAVTEEWCSLTDGNPEITILPGTHYSILRPPIVDIVAGRIRPGGDGLPLAADSRARDWDH
jgi:thioesterase domain-containing protein